MAVAMNHQILSDNILARCAERASIYDREGLFFDEDFEELRQAGYLRMNVPTLTMADAANCPSACHAPAVMFLLDYPSLHGETGVTVAKKFTWLINKG